MMELRYLADRAVHVAAEPAHPRQLGRRAGTSCVAGRGVRDGQGARHLQPPRRRLTSARRPTRARRGAGPPGSCRPGQRAPSCCPDASACRSTSSASCWAMRALARRGTLAADAVVLFAGRERDALTSALVRRLAARPAARGRGALSRRGEGHPVALLGVGPSGDAVAVRGARQRGAGRVRRRAAGHPLARRQRRRIVRPGETGWEVPTGRHAPLVRALEEALATPADRLARDGAGRRAPT